jgi:Fe-S-cluster containining protein
MLAKENSVNPHLEYIPSSIDTLGLTPEQRKAAGYLAEFARRMVSMAFAEGKTPAGAAGLIEELYRVTDELVSGCLRRGAKPPCKQGCFWCCFLRVKATPLEVMRIVDYIQARLQPEELSGLRQRLASADKITRGMDGPQRLAAKMACPLLVEGACLAYPARPIACRVYHSLDTSHCEALLQDPGASVTIRSDISTLSMGLSAGLTEGLRAVGLQPRLVELIAGLRLAMDDAGLVERWLAGESVFMEAEAAGAGELDSFHRVLVEELAEPLV